MTYAYCEPGTRYSRIMAMIDNGFSDEDIAERVRTTKRTIAVYRKAHDGTLTEPSGNSMYEWCGELWKCHEYV